MSLCPLLIFALWKHSTACRKSYTNYNNRSCPFGALYWTHMLRFLRTSCLIVLTSMNLWSNVSWHIWVRQWPAQNILKPAAMNFSWRKKSSSSKSCTIFCKPFCNKVGSLHLFGIFHEDRSVKNYKWRGRGRTAISLWIQMNCLEVTDLVSELNFQR